MESTKYHNLFRTTGVFKYVYKDGNFEIGARDWNDLKFKLAIQKIKLQEKTQEQNKSFNEKINKPSPKKKHSNDHHITMSHLEKILIILNQKRTLVLEKIDLVQY